MTPSWSRRESLTHQDVETVTVQPDQLFRAIFEQAAVGVALIETATGRFVRVNQRYGEIVGLAQDTMTATTFMAITHPDDLQADLINMEALTAGRIPKFSMEKRYIRSNGSIVWVELTVSPLWGAGERPNFHIAVVQDITERKHAELNLAMLNATLEQQVTKRTRELEESRQQVQAILDGTSDAVFIKDTQGRYLFLNEATERFIGKQQHEVIGHDDTFIFPPADAEAVMEGDRRVMAGAVAMTYEDVATTSDGVQRTFLSTKGPLFDGQGRVIGLFGISRDITERKQAEEALRRLNETLEHRVAERTEALQVSEHFRKEVLDSLSAHLAVLDAAGVIVAVNRVWEKAARLNDPSGRARVSTGANYLHVCERAADHSPEVQRTLEGILDVLGGRKQVFESEYLCVWPGDQRWFSMRVTPLSDRRGCVIAHEDVTERKRAEEALRDSYQRLQALSREVQVAKERERSRLSRELHDEFGQVLSGLKLELTAAATSLMRGQDSAGVRLRVKSAVCMVDRLFVSLREMVTALRPSVLEELGLVPALETLAADIRARSGLECHLVARGMDRQAHCGPEVEGALFRIAQELLTNVVRHAKAARATITIAGEEGRVVLAVQDDGRGFDVQAVGGKHRFGLRGAQERAELLGGTMIVASTRKIGTTVTVSIPLELPPSDDAQRVPNDTRMSRSVQTRSRCGT